MGRRKQFKKRFSVPLGAETLGRSEKAYAAEMVPSAGNFGPFLAVLIERGLDATERKAKK